MTDTNVIKLAQPGTFTDSLTEVLRNGAHALLTQAVEMEVAHFLERYADLKTKAGHQRVVRHGHLPEREIMTGIGSVAVRQPRVRDREAVGGERIRFSPTILPPYARRTKSLAIPILYLKGISTGDFEEALAALLGKDAGGLSASTIARLKEAWVDEHARWLDRDLSAKRYVYFWVDGIHVQARLEDDAPCLLVIIGATPEGKKELVGLTDGRARMGRHPADVLPRRCSLGGRSQTFWADQLPRSQLNALQGARRRCRGVRLGRASGLHCSPARPTSPSAKIFSDQAMTLAAIDRLVHHATILEMNVESYRRKAALKRKRGPRRLNGNTAQPS